MTHKELQEAIAEAIASARDLADRKDMSACGGDPLSVEQVFDIVVDEVAGALMALDYRFDPVAFVDACHE